MGKFSVRIVPDQNPKKIARLVERFLTDAHERRGTPNTLDVKVFRDGRPFLADHKTVNFNCAARAIERVWGKSPDLTRDGAAIPVAIALEESTMRDVCLIPMGQCLDYQHEYNERLAVENYMNGMKVFLTYFYELASCEAEDSDDEAERQQERAKWRAKML